MSTTSEAIDRARKTNSRITIDIISMAKQQQRMIDDLLLTLEAVMGGYAEDEEDDSA